MSSPVKTRLLAGAAVMALGAGVFAYAPGGAPAFSTPALAQAQSAAALTARPGFAPVVRKVKPAVVAVQVAIQQAVSTDTDDESGPQGMPQLSPNDPMERFFRQFRGQQGNGNGNGGLSPHPQVRKGMAQGSGFFISADGLLVTNNHVVENGVEFRIKMDDGTELPATLVGRDPKTDLAVLKVKGDGREFPFVKFARGESEVGDWVIAVGNPFGLGGTVTAGIVSARGRDIGSGPYDDYIQIDAPVNRGNSGGPTFNSDGEVIGVNTAIYSPSGGSVGIGFAIPASTVEKVVGELSKAGRVTRGWLGIQMQPVTGDIAKGLGLEKAEGVLVAEPQDGSPALKAGIKAGDVILSLNGKPVLSTHAMARDVADLAPGATASFEVLRDGSRKTVNVTIGDYPGEKTVASRSGGSDTDADAPKLGLALSASPDGRGVVVAQVDPNGAGASKGLQQGDIILDVGGKGVNRPDEVKRGLSSAKADGKAFVLARVKNAQGTHFVALPLTSKAG